MEVRWLEAARFDIDEIYSHIEADNRRAADKVFGYIIAAVQALTSARCRIAVVPVAGPIPAS